MKTIKNSADPRPKLVQQSTQSAVCSSYLAATVTPCAITVFSTSTVTSTTIVSNTNFPEKREIEAQPKEIEIRQTAQSICTAVTITPTALPAFAITACTQIGTTVPAARFSSACSCDGITMSTSTLPAQTIVSTTTSTVTATVSPTPALYILNASGDTTLFVTVDDAGALVLSKDASAANPFYLDAEGQLRNALNPAALLVDYYIPNSNTASDQVFSAVPSADNFRITCSYAGHNTIGPNGEQYYGSCQASGPADGNPVAYGFGTCPNEGYFVYLIPNNSNVKCFDGGYAFLGFYLQPYSG